MASKSRSSLASGARALAAPAKAHHRLLQALVPVSWWIGCAGLAALGACGVLWALPPRDWPAVLDPDRLAFYVLASLAVASLTGWGCLQEGQTRLGEALRGGSGVVFLAVLPLACAIARFALGRGWVCLDEVAGGVWIDAFIRWYPPLVMAVALGAFLTWKSRDRSRVRWGRGAAFFVAVTPYVLITGYLVTGIRVPWVEDAMADSLESLGAGALALQLAVGYLTGASPDE